MYQIGTHMLTGYWAFTALMANSPLTRLSSKWRTLADQGDANCSSESVIFMLVV